MDSPAYTAIFFPKTQTSLLLGQQTMGSFFYYYYLRVYNETYLLRKS